MSEIPGDDYKEAEDDLIADDSTIDNIGFLEDLGSLSEEPDEDSSENELLVIAQETRKLLSGFGVEGVNQAGKDAVIQLWHKMEMSQHLIGDLILYTYSHKQKTLKNQLAVPHFSDLYGTAETLVNPFEVRTKLIEQAAPQLVNLGYSELDAYWLPKNPDPNIAQAFKVLGWLLDQPFMDEFPGQIKNMVRASPQRTLKNHKVFKATLDELARQLRIMDSTEIKNKYDHRIGYQAEAYEQLHKIINNSHNIADLTFSRFISSQK